MWRLLSSGILGWSLGANDSANVFGTAVATRMIRYSTAVILTSVFVVLGAVLFGARGFETLNSITRLSVNTAFVASLATAVTVSLMTVLKLPISTSQAVVGAILGIGLMQSDTQTLDLEPLVTILLCWLGTPVGAFLACLGLYLPSRAFLRRLKPSLFVMDSFIKSGLVVSGCFGAFALGANNVANITGVYVPHLLTPEQGVLLGGASIVLGVVTYSRNVMTTVGTSIVKLDAFSALVVVLAHSIVVQIYALVGVPVSSTQAIIGAVFAVGFIKGAQTIRFSALLRVVSGWLLTPAVALGLAMAFYFIGQVITAVPILPDL